MKYILSILLLIPFCGAAQQDSTTVQEENIDDRILFRSKVTQLTSYLNEGNESAAKRVFRDVSDEMQAYIAETKAAMDSTKGSEHKKLEQKFERQRQLFMQFQSFQSNLIRNKSSIHTWADQFIQTLY